jgi:hypothetical protein
MGILRLFHRSVRVRVSARVCVRDVEGVFLGIRATGPYPCFPLAPEEMYDTLGRFKVCE